MKISRVVVIVVITFFAGCSQLGSSQIEIRNKVDVPLTGVEIEIGGERVHVDMINPGAVAKASFEPSGDSGVRISYREGQDSRILSCVGDVYVTTGIRQHLVAIIGPDQSCQVEEVE